MGDLSEAEREKAQGNSFFTQNLYMPAVEHYTLAINATPNENGENNTFLSVLYGNRAFAHLRMENFGLVISDATQAIELDPNYAKGFYRRAAANMVLEHWSKAIADFKEVVKLNPKDRNAREKLAQCQKLQRAKAFADAISMEHDRRSPFDNLDVAALTIDAEYAGPRMVDDKTVTASFILDLMELFKNQKNIPKKYLYEILVQMRAVLKAQPNVVTVPMEGEEPCVTVCGDVHGQFYDLLNVFNKNGIPSPTNRYLFNGDFVDRGSFSCEVVITLFAWKILYPDNFFLARGNHETKAMNKAYGFEGEVKHKYGELAMELFAEVFNHLPLGHVIGEKVFVVHGGLFSADGVKLADLQKLNRFCEPAESGLMAEMLWSDPQVAPGRGPSKRGVGSAFGPDVTKRFLQDNNLELIIRSHEVKENGYQVEHDGKLITVFSAPNYCDQVGNLGAYITLKKDLVPRFTSYAAVPHPSVPPMAFASPMFGF